MDRERGMGVPHHPARRRRDAGAWSGRAGVRGPRHLRRRVRQRRARADRRQHVPELARGREAAPQDRRQRDPGALRVSDREGQAGLRQARLQAPRRQRSGQGDAEHVRAQGALPLRLGLGPALRHQRHLAAGRAGGVGRGTTRRCADLPEQAGHQGRGARDRGARRRRPRRQGAGHRGAAGRADARPRRRHAQAGRQRREAGRAHRQAGAVVAGGPRPAEALHAGDAADGRRRQAARRARDAHRPANGRGRPRARPRGQELHHQGQRRARVHEGRELDPGGQLRHARDDRRATGCCCSRPPTRT